MSTFDDLVNDVAQTLYGYGLAQPRATFLQTSVDSDDTQFVVRDVTSFEQGVAEIDNETVFVESIDAASKVLTISPDGRGYYGSSAAAHAANARVTMSPTWSRQRIARAINETILGCQPTLFGVGSTTFSFNPSITTYELPTEVQSILQVTADTIGPTKEQQQIKRYRFDGKATTDDFATGKSIVLEAGPFPGRDVNVTYRKPLSAIDFGDDWTDCGLSETAKLAVKYGACSNLTAFMDSSRLPIDVAQADELDPSKNAVGTAARISAQLWQRYLVEIEAERRRLRSITPTAISVRTR